MSRAKLVPLLVLLVVGLVTACGGSDDGQPAAASTPSASSAITIEDFAFSPVLATAEVGDTITVTNKDSVTHTLTADDGSFDTGKLAPDRASITVDSAGTFTYHCAIHSYMKGTVEVTG
ncbi:MAG: secreted metal-binding protein [Actinomycetia bacterium]|nr:secreted metal-binding protein [Actinomycetes bacterium]